MRISKLKKNTILKNGTVIDPLNNTEKKADVHIENGLIKSIGKVSTQKSAETLDCKGLIITHGFCDLHAHFREPGREDKEDLNSGSESALAGGFTRVCIMPNSEPPVDSPEVIRYLIERSDECPIYIHPIGTITKGQKGGELTEMGTMISEGAVAFSDDGLPVSDSGVMLNALTYSTMFDIPIINHAEDDCLKRDGLMHLGKTSTELGLAASPDLVESNMVFRDLELSVFTGSRLHIPHVSTAKSVDHIKTIKKKNSKISAEVTPHHLYFIDENLSSYNTNLKVAPPIRSRNDRSALIKAVKNGIINCIATDHAPHTWDEKNKPYPEAPAGLPLVQHGLQILMDFFNNDILTLETIVEKTSHNVAKRFQVKDRGYIREGYYADLAILDLNNPYQVSKDNILYKCGWSPFEGHKFNSSIFMTIVNGNIAFKDGVVSDNLPFGMQIEFNR